MAVAHGCCMGGLGLLCTVGGDEVGVLCLVVDIFVCLLVGFCCGLVCVGKIFYL